MTSTPTTAVQTATVSPTESPEPAATLSPTSTAFTVSDISLPSCNTGGSTTTGSLGTALGPTPTPQPEIGSRDAALVRDELSEYFANASPVIEHLAAWSEAFNSAWAAGPEPNWQAQELHVLGIRVAQVCNAVARITQVPPEAAGFDSLMREATRVRHAWVRFAVGELECCGTATLSTADTGNVETSAVVSSLASEADALMEQYDALPARTRTFTDQVIGIEMSVEEGWLISADGLNPILYAPFVLNRPGLSGLGPDRWQRGGAVRVRRLRNPEAIDAETASSRFMALVTQQGGVSSVEQKLVSGAPALRHVISANAPDWAATATVFVSGEFTYFVETGCPSDVAGSCESVNAVAGSLRLIP